MLTISPEKVCYIIVKAREFDMKEAPTELNDGGNPSGDQFFEVLEERGGRPGSRGARRRFRGAQPGRASRHGRLSIGRGEFVPEQWSEARSSAAGIADKLLIRELVTIPLLGDYLEEGLSAFGQSCLDFEAGRL